MLYHAGLRDSDSGGSGASDHMEIKGFGGIALKAEILNLLKKQTGYLSGQEICDRFGVSRTAVWKVINQLKEEGYQIEAVSRRGYRLLSCPEVLSEQEIMNGLNTRWAGKKIFYYDEIIL